MRAYVKKRKLIDDQSTNVEEYIDIRSYLSKNKIRCFKYNYSLDKQVQNFECYNAFIILSSDYQHLTFINRKPNEKTKYILEGDPELVQQERLKEHQKMKEMLQMKKSSR